MGDLVFLNKRDMSLLVQYVDSLIDISGLIEGEDFEIVSMIVMDNEYNTYSLGGFFGSTSEKLFKDESIS